MSFNEEEISFDPQVEYARGFLLSRYIAEPENINGYAIKIITYKSERDIIQKLVKCFDKFASQIGITNVRPSHSADYTYNLSITASTFIAKLCPATIKSTHPLFHGMFDSLSNLRFFDNGGPKIIFDMNENIYDIFKRTIQDLFGDSLHISQRTVLTTKQEIEKWRDALYFSESNLYPYNYATSKETQITHFLQSKETKNSFQKKYKPHFEAPHQKIITPAPETMIDVINRTAIIETPPAREYNDIAHTHNYIEIVQLDENMVMPSYGTPDSVGLDVSVVRHWKTVGRVQYYYCGFSVAPPTGHYIEIYARSSLPGKGYMLANSVGIIDPDYRGELIVQLIRTDDSNEHITNFPMSVAQMIVRPFTQHQINKSAEHLNANTKRGAGGFGSTDKR